MKALVPVVVAAFVIEAASAEELVTIPTRNSVTQSFVLEAPESGKPAAAAVLFAGSGGNIRMRVEDGRISFAQGNFLVRSRQRFVEAGIAVAVVDTPSDEPQGMNDWFRLGEKHAADSAAVIAELKKRYADVPVFLVGTSRGTVSAAAVGRALGEKVAGVVLTSALFVGGGRSGPGLSGFEFGSIGVPLLFVHHAEDGCRFTPYRSAKALANRYPLITVRGGDPARSNHCEALSAHGYLGREAPTVEAITNWMLKKPYRQEID